MYVTCDAVMNATLIYIGAGTGPAGPAMAGPFSAEVDIITRSTFVWSRIAVVKFGRVRT